MRLVDPTTTELIGELEYYTAASGGGTEFARLPIITMGVSGLPDSLDAVVATSDLQGIVRDVAGRSELLGEALAVEYAALADVGMVPALSRTLLVLAGDFFSSEGADRRGATGDVSAVWQAFADVGFAHVVGVAGNHDTWGTEKQHQRLAARAEVEILDGNEVECAGVALAGLGYIPGRADRTGRRDPDEYYDGFARLIAASPDVLVVHPSPRVDRERRGDPHIAEMLETSSTMLMVSGHMAWPQPDAKIGAVDVLNVHERVVVLVAGS